jgi:hypothetical protein
MTDRDSIESRWRDDDAWTERLARDRELMSERIGRDRMLSIGSILATLDGRGPVDFLVVWGSAARHGVGDANDIDLYFEAPWIPDDADQKPIEVRDNHEGSIFHALGWAPGRLLVNLRSGWGLSFGLVRDALIFVDRGPYRDALIRIDDEHLELAEGETMDRLEDAAGGAEQQATD